MKLLVTILLPLIFLACKFNDKEIHLEATSLDISEVKYLHLDGLEITFDSILLKPTGLIINDSSIITRNAFTENIFHIYDVTNKRKTGEKILLGQGPDEMFFPLFSENNNTHISIFEHSKQKIFTFNTSEFIYDSKPKPIKEVKLAKDVNYVYILKDQTIIGSLSNDADSLIILFNPDGTKKKEFGLYPESTLGLNDLMKIEAYSHRSLAYNREKGLIMLFYFFTDLIDLYSFNGERISLIQGPDNFPPIFNPNGTSVKGKTRVAFWGQPIFNNQYCYILYSGDLYQDFTEEINKIYVFNWEGKLVQILNLGRSIFSFDIDFENRVIYGITNTPDVAILKFDLPSI